ncbi:hypothetical protein AC249_AIPGENE5033 [Exaiptasia diaphana]|nr:hypothetical protein AC249_AIPGENE5033 [Exaiptasia diaphana]
MSGRFKWISRTSEAKLSSAKCSISLSPRTQCYQKEELRHTNFALYDRTIEEFKKPFKDFDSPVRQKGLELVSIEKHVVQCAHKERWMREKGDPKEHAKRYVATMRSWSNATLISVSNPEGPGPVVAAVKGSVSLASRSVSFSVSGIIEQDEKTKICVNDEMPSNGNSFMTHTLSTLHM